MTAVTGARDGRWQVGEAGAVTFTAREDGLALDDVTAEPGWSSNVAREQADRLEVDFRRGTEEWEFEVTLRNGLLSIELEHEQEEAEPGRYEVGDAGTVEIAVEQGELRIVEIHTHPGWSMEIEEQKAREVEIEFRRGLLEWEFEAELSKRGRLEVEIEMEVEGPFPAFKV